MTKRGSPFIGPSKLPDVSSSRTETLSSPLKWVGIENWRLPFRWFSSRPFQLGRVQAKVNLLNPSQRGIHMSRLWELMEAFVNQRAILECLSGLEILSHQAIKSQGDGVTEAFFEWKSYYLVQKKTLATHRDVYHSYPLTFQIIGDHLIKKVKIKTCLIYGSVCPQSAALAVQAQQEEGLSAWPHAQRSLAFVSIEWSWSAFQDFWQKQGSSFDSFFADLADCLGTESQMLVKREDEKEFARRMGKTPMFCEDAARRLGVYLASIPRALIKGKVRHLESLHPYDVAASFVLKNQ